MCVDEVANHRGGLPIVAGLPFETLPRDRNSCMTTTEPNNRPVSLGTPRAALVPPSFTRRKNLIIVPVAGTTS